MDPVERLSAITLGTLDMATSVAFYEALGFHRLYGGPEADFTSYRVGPGYLNLDATTRPPDLGAVWGRVVFW